MTLYLADEWIVPHGRGRVQIQIWEEVAPSEKGTVVTAYRVQTSTGYRAILPACLADRCLSGEAENCLKSLRNNGQHAGMSVNRWCEHVQTHCRGWHLQRVQQLAEQVAATYGSARRRETSLSTLIRSQAPRLSVKEWAEHPYAQALEGREQS